MQVVEHAQVGALLARVLGVNTFDMKAKATACVAGWQSSYLIDDQNGSCLSAPPCTLGYPVGGSGRPSVTFNESDVLRGLRS